MKIALKKQLPHIYQDKAGVFEQFLDLLIHWNKTYNLTAIRNKEDMIALHLLDSLAIIPYIKGPKVIDVGTGAGFPGIPLAICLPQLEFTLVDSNGKRIQFLHTVKHHLNLSNINIWQGRIEQYQPDAGFDTITSRAFSKLSHFITLTHPLCVTNGQWCAMKGQVPAEELQGLSYPYEIHRYDIPGQDVARCCIIIKNKE